MATPVPDRSAELSEPRYRYSLARNVGGLLDDRRVLFIMLNPSTADEHQDDPTIRRCMGFTRELGFGWVSVVNLFALRSTDPDQLAHAAHPIGRDPAENDAWIESQVNVQKANGWPTIAAWGAHPFAIPRARDVTARFGPFECLGMTKDGHPRHPLYVPRGTRLIPYAGGATIAA